jgi:hypothetical protein
MLEKARTLRPYDGYIVDSVGWPITSSAAMTTPPQPLAAVLLVPGDPTINDHLGDALWRAGRRIDARFQREPCAHFSDNETDKAAIERKLEDGLSESLLDDHRASACQDQSVSAVGERAEFSSAAKPGGVHAYGRCAPDRARAGTVAKHSKALRQRVGKRGRQSGAARRACDSKSRVAQG